MTCKCNEWQKIDSATRDSTKVLVTNGKDVCIAAFDEYAIKLWRKPRWFRGNHALSEPPTHWMPLKPLPKPPTISEARQNEGESV